MGIGKKLSLLLNQKGISVNELGIRVGVIPMTIYHVIKRDGVKMDINMLADIAKELGVPLEYFSDRYVEAVPDVYKGREQQLVAQYRKLSSVDKDTIDRIIKGFLDRDEAEAKKGEIASG